MRQLNHRLVFLIILALVVINLVLFGYLFKKNNEIQLVKIQSSAEIKDLSRIIDDNEHLLKDLKQKEAFLHTELEEREKKDVEIEEDHRSKSLHLDDKVVAAENEITTLKLKINDLAHENEAEVSKLKASTHVKDDQINSLNSKIKDLIREKESNSDTQNTDSFPLVTPKEYTVPFTYDRPASNPGRFEYWNPQCLSNDIETQAKQTKDLLSKCPYIKGTPKFYEDTKGYTHPARDLFKIWLEFVWCQVPFAFIRYGDGEYHMSVGMALTKKGQNFLRDRWYWDGGVGKLGRDLNLALKTKGNFFIGLPCPVYESLLFIDAFNFAMTAMDQTQPIATRSQSLLFWGKNWKYFIHFMWDIIEGKLGHNLVLVLNKSFQKKHDFFMTFCRTVYYLPDDGPNLYEAQREELLNQIGTIAKSHQNSLFLFAGGPLAKPLIAEMWRVSKCNQYVDVGSALHYFIEGMPKREDTKEAEHVCPTYKYGLLSKTPPKSS